ncbi:hypothetical protein [Bradyrhizobium sp. BR 10261]|uniref:hypothetical protein n=1 Tax=Bradyrhizobium sp. BR 10261 TaxID=2749992 RepID=UPI001C653E06|nr:hypothetical protein [Bradyrhizobium sp. BR 10261]MBW7965986.1 hypothetical protein [Bradyrhizobium sp. BR 10261]
MRIRNNDYAMQIWLATGAWRVVFWRAFKAEDRAVVLNWSRQAGNPAASRDP